MYHTHWGLRETPFKSTLDARDFYPSATHEEALARLHFLVECRRRMGLLLSPSGCGKSLVLEVLADELHRRQHFRVAKFSLLGLEPVEFALALARGWGLNPDADAPLWRLWHDLSDRLAEHRLQRASSIALLDDADEARSDVLAQVARLAHCQLTGDGRLTLILSVHPQRISTLGRRLLELADLRIDIQPWALADTEGYLRHVLARAGRTAATFDASALARLHELSGGVPRHIGQVAELALLAGAGQGLSLVDAHTVETVCDELSVHANA